MTATPKATGFSGHFISAPWRSSGKSMLSMGLARAVTRRAINVQTFKKGPDYIDPLWLKAASYKPSYNLDPYLQSEQELQRTFLEHMNDMMLVEGTMGLHDGLALDGHDCNASVAKKLGLPVLLVMDCRGMHRTIASLVNGIVQFDPDVKFSGIVLNNIRSTRHASKIENAIQEYCDVKVVGVVPEVPQLFIDERELGLIPAPDYASSTEHIDAEANVVEASVNIDNLCEINCTMRSPLSIKYKPAEITMADSKALRIAIAQDEAFHFYYADDLEILCSRGVTLVPFSPMRDTFPADVDGVLIGGGFPERHAAALAENKPCRQNLAKAIHQGLPVRAECAGLMYLCRTIELDRVVWPMVGAIDGAVSMHKTPRGRGYMNLVHNSSYAPAYASESGKEEQKTLHAHEFHHSEIAFETTPVYAYRVTRGHGVDSEHDGVCVRNVVASYAHFRHTEATPWIDWFLDSIQSVKQDVMNVKNQV